MIRLSLIAHLRQASLLPWILLVAWVGWAVLQEPLVLRRSGILLGETAAAGGGVVVLAALLGGGLRWEVPSLPRNVCALLLVVTVASAQTALVCVFEAAVGRPLPVNDAVAHAARFVLAWTGASLTWSSYAAGRAKLWWVPPQILVAIGLATSIADGFSVSSVVAAATSCLAACLADVRGVGD